MRDHSVLFCKRSCAVKREYIAHMLFVVMGKNDTDEEAWMGKNQTL
ncbi:hypothetical protein [Acetobacter indonesiensis]